MLGVDDTTRIDARVRAFMSAHHIPNGALAIVSADGRLVYAKGFTNVSAYRWARTAPYYAGPDSRFRIAGLSKVLTGLAAIKVFSEWRLHPAALDAPLGEILDLGDVPFMFQEDGTPAPAQDPRLQDIRLRHLLEHSAGWMSEAPVQDSTRGFVSVEQVWPRFPWADRAQLSPQFDVTDAYPWASYFSQATLPLTVNHLFRYGNLLPLSWIPGDHVSHTNYGHWLVGLAIEAATCRSYDSVVQEVFLAPLGMDDTAPGDCERARRLVGEVPYFVDQWPWEEGATRDVVYHSVHAGGSFTTPDLPPDYLPYATWDLRLGLATGGWVSSVHDLAVLCRDLFCGASTTLSDTSVGLALLRAARTSESTGWTFGGLEWSEVAGRTSYQKSGRLSGTMAWLYNFGDRVDAPGVSLIYLFNRSSEAATAAEPAFRRGLVGSLGAVGRITAWGRRDLF